MSDQKPLPLIGRIALQLKMVTAEQLSELTRAQAKEGVRRMCADDARAQDDDLRRRDARHAA